MLYDVLPLLAVMFIAAVVALPVTGDRVRAGQDIGYSLYLAAAGFVYYGLCWTRAGKTLGMRAWKVEIVTLDGHHPGWGRALGRYAATLLSLVPLGLGIWVAAWRSDRACWHDRLSGTRLLRRP